MKHTKESAPDQSFLDTFNLKQKEKAVLLDLISNGASSVASIATRTNIPKSTVYDSLSDLLSIGLINEYSDEKGKMFGISDKTQLTYAHQKKIEEMQKAHSELLSFIESHPTSNKSLKPKIKFYSGTLGMKQAFRDMPWNKEHKEALLMWPLKDMLEQLDEEFLKWHGAPRFTHKIQIRVVQKDDDRKLQSPEHEWLRDDFMTYYREVRYMPKEIDWKMSYWIYGNKCLFASGGAEKFAFVVDSVEFCHLMRIMFEGVWQIAKK